MSAANLARVARSQAHSLESCASLVATMCSMSVSDVVAKQVPVLGPQAAHDFLLNRLRVAVVALPVVG